MSFNFTGVQNMSIPEGVVTKITDASGRVLWQPGGEIVLMAEKITSNTYAAETLYENEQFILLDIYPETNGAVTVTYGGLTKTITDTSGAAEPNAQQVFFGSFNGESDGVTTPVSGKLRIKGDCRAFAAGWYTSSSSAKNNDAVCDCVISVESFGNIEIIPASAFRDCRLLKRVGDLTNIKSVGDVAFNDCAGLESMIIPAELSFSPIIFAGAIDQTGYSANMSGSFLTVDENHPTYSYKGNCFITKSNNAVVFGFSDAVIPNGVSSIAEKAFRYTGGLLPVHVIPEGVKTISSRAYYNSTGITDLTIPSSVTNIGEGAFYGINTLARVVVLAESPPIAPYGNNYTYMFSASNLESITVPKGCGAAYKAADEWCRYADYIVEAS